ncbi:MAG: hypothetical protein ACOC46_03165, partial [Pirellulales bacterium]
EQLVAVRIVKGTLVTTRRYRREQTYNVKNRGDKAREVLVEHPFDAEWKLVEPDEPAERTREVYRFAVSAEPGKTHKLAVVEERQVDESVALANLDDDRIVFFLRAKEVSQEVKDALGKLVEMKRALAETIRQREELEGRVAQIDREQSRIRENMGRLDRNSELYRRYVGILGDQEDELAELRGKIDALRDREAQQRRALDDYLLSLDVK